MEQEYTATGTLWFRVEARTEREAAAIIKALRRGVQASLPTGVTISTPESIDVRRS